MALPTLSRYFGVPVASVSGVVTAYLVTLAMAMTMVAAIMGASVDTGVLPSIVHGTIAYGAIACNLAALKIEVDALSASSRIVDEVNRLLRA